MNRCVLGFRRNEIAKIASFETHNELEMGHLFFKKIYKNAYVNPDDFYFKYTSENNFDNMIVKTYKSYSIRFKGENKLFFDKSFLNLHDYIFIYNVIKNKIEVFGNKFKIKEKINYEYNFFDIPFYASLNSKSLFFLENIYKNITTEVFLTLLEEQHKQEILLYNREKEYESR